MSEVNAQKRECELKEGKVEGGAISHAKMVNFQDHEVQIACTGRLFTNVKPSHHARFRWLVYF